MRKNCTVPELIGNTIFELWFNLSVLTGKN